MSLRGPVIAGSGAVDPWSVLLDDLDKELDGGLGLEVTSWTRPKIDTPLPASLAPRAEELLARIDGRRRELEVALHAMGTELDELAVRRRSASASTTGTAGRFASPRTATLDRLA